MNNNTYISSASRNMGIELLRIISMLMVVSLHCLGHGGILQNTHTFSLNNNIAWFIEIFCYCAVNIYVLITGYVSINSIYRFSRIIVLWIQVVFCSLCTLILFKVTMPSTVSLKQFILALFPVSTQQYWFFTSYFALFMFIPIYNFILKSLSKEKLHNLIGICILLFSILSFISKYLGGDIFYLNDGHSFLWFSVLYLIGGYVKLYPETFLKISTTKCLITYLLCVLIVWGSRFLISFITLKKWGNIKYDALLVSYTSPFILLCAMSLLLIFTRIKISHFTSIIQILASTTFGVYIFSEHPYIRSFFIIDTLKPFAESNLFIMLSHFLLKVFTIYLLCTLLDYLRKLLFDLFRIRDRCMKYCESFSKKFFPIK